MKVLARTRKDAMLMFSEWQPLMNFCRSHRLRTAEANKLLTKYSEDLPTFCAQIDNLWRYFGGLSVDGTPLADYLECTEEDIKQEIDRCRRLREL